MAINIWAVLEQNWVATLIGVIALIVTIYQIFRKNEPRLSYQFRSLRLIGKKTDPVPDDVKVLFQGSEIDHLSRTEIMIWNAGKVAVRGTDLVNSDPLKFDFNGDATILSVEVEKTTRDSLQFAAEISQDRSSVLISFDFIDHLDGALVKIWHDGYDLTPNSSGTIIGQKQGLVGLGRYLESVQNTQNLSSPATRFEAVVRKIFPGRLVSRKLFPWGIILAGLFLAIFGYYKEKIETAFPILGGRVSDESSPYVALGFGVLYSLTGVWFLYISRRRFPRAITPFDTEEGNQRLDTEDQPLT